MSSYQCDPIFSYPEEMNSNIGNRKIKMADRLTSTSEKFHGLYNFPRPHLEVDEAIVVLEDFAAGALGELGGVTGKEVGRDMELDGNLGCGHQLWIAMEKNQGTCQPQRFVNTPCSFHPREIGGKHFFGIQHHVIRWTMIGPDM